MHGSITEFLMEHAGPNIDRTRGTFHQLGVCFDQGPAALLAGVLHAGPSGSPVRADIGPFGLIVLFGKTGFRPIKPFFRTDFDVILGQLIDKPRRHA